MARFDFSEVKDLASDLRRVEIDTRRDTKEVVASSARRLVREWKQNARETAREHGKHYPKAIGYDGPYWIGNGWEANTGPDADAPEAVRQGGMNFEYGSRNQNPHLDGNRAADNEEPRFAAAAARAAVQAFWRVEAP